MKIFSFETVGSLPALYHPDLDLLVISDIHLGLEGTMSADGNYVPKFQLEQLLEDLLRKPRSSQRHHVYLSMET